MRHFDKFYFFFAGVSKLSAAVKITAPIIVQRMLYVLPLNFKIIGSGSSSSRDNHEPIMAPIKPTIIDITHPPLLNPESERAIEPAKPAMMSEIRMSIIFLYNLLYSLLYKLYFIYHRINLVNNF